MQKDLLPKIKGVKESKEILDKSPIEEKQDVIISEFTVIKAFKMLKTQSVWKLLQKKDQ